MGKCLACDGEVHPSYRAHWFRPTTPPLVANASNTVANAETKVANKHGKYADLEKRKAYQRDLMRKRRAEKRAT